MGLVIHNLHNSPKDLFEIIYQDSELLVINKPAGLVCHPTKTDQYSSLISRVRLYLEKDAHPQAKNLSRLAYGRFEKKVYDDVETLVPIYLYSQDCQVDLSRKK